MDNGRVDFFRLKQLTFEEPDTDTFRGLALAYRAARCGGSMPTVFNAANEKAVALFLQKKITFLQIPELIEASMDAHKVIEKPDVEQILETEALTYEYIKQKFGE
jgi:1-deoxy-D-xylulose-5-phosphate reductoisomerase